MTTTEKIAIVAIIVPNSIVLDKWYWDAKKQAATPKAHPQTTAQNVRRVSSGHSSLLFGLAVSLNFANLAFISFSSEPLSRWSVTSICLSVGVLVFMSSSLTMFRIVEAIFPARNAEQGARPNERERDQAQ